MAVAALSRSRRYARPQERESAKCVNRSAEDQQGAIGGGADSVGYAGRRGLFLARRWCRGSQLRPVDGSPRRRDYANSADSGECSCRPRRARNDGGLELMARRRMFSLDVVDTDRFLDMPISAQALYYHMGMRADDDGFVASPKRIAAICGCGADDIKLLVAKGFVVPFDTGHTSGFHRLV